MKKKRIRKAKNWSVAEAVRALREGDIEARIDLSKRFPLFTTSTDREILDEITLMTARQVEIRMKKKIFGEDYNEPEDTAEDTDKGIDKAIEEEAELVIEEEKETKEDIKENKTDYEDIDLDDLFDE